MNPLGSAMAVAPRIYDRHAMTATSDRPRIGIVPLALECLTVLAWDNGDEIPLRFIPLGERALRTRTAGVPGVLLHQMSYQVAVTEIDERHEIDHGCVALRLQLIELVEHERDSTTHSRGEVATGATEHDDGATGHVLAAVIADPFDDGDSPAVAHSEPLAGDAGEVRFARRCTVEHRVADQNRLIGDELCRTRMTNDQSPTRESFTHVIIRLSLKLEGDSAHGKSTKALARRADESERDGSIRQTFVTA